MQNSRLNKMRKAAQKVSRSGDKIISTTPMNKSQENQRKHTAFSFGYDSSDDDTFSNGLASKRARYGSGKICVIRSESPSRERGKKKNATPIEFCTDLNKNNGRYLRSAVKTVTKERESPPSSKRSSSSAPSTKKSVTWGSETRHEYNEMSPVFDSPEKGNATGNRKVRITASLVRLGTFSVHC